MMTLVVPLLRFLFFVLHHVNIRWEGKYLLYEAVIGAAHIPVSLLSICTAPIYASPLLSPKWDVCSFWDLWDGAAWGQGLHKTAAWHTFPGSPHSYGHSSSLVMPCLFILASSWEFQCYGSSWPAFVAEIGPHPMLSVSFIWYLAPPIC